MSFPIEIIFQIFEEVFLFQDKFTNDNIFLTSRWFNGIFSELIKNKFERKFKVKVNIEKSIYRSIIDVSIIQTMCLNDDEYMLENKKRKIVKYSKTMIVQRRLDLIKFAEEVCIHYKFIIRLDFLDYGKKMYRKMLVKNHEMSPTDIENGAFHSASKFRKFHQKYKYTFGCEYRPYSVCKIKCK